MLSENTRRIRGSLAAAAMLSMALRAIAIPTQVVSPVIMRPRKTGRSASLQVPVIAPTYIPYRGANLEHTEWNAAVDARKREMAAARRSAQIIKTYDQRLAKFDAYHANLKK
jgi:hypothetical protein